MSDVNTTPIMAMRDAFLLELYKAMQSESDIFFITADFGSPVLDKIRSDFPDRFINVGIAEQNLINVSAGLALEGFRVFSYSIAPFITMRCYEQIRVNLALLSEVRPMNVNLIGVGAGYSYVVSGPTHQCYEDISIMRTLPNMEIYSPADQIMAAALVKPCLETAGPKYLRLDAQALPVLYKTPPGDLNAGFHQHRTGDDACIIATGYMMHTALKVVETLAAEGVSVGVVDLFNVTGFSADELLSTLASYKGMVTMEEGFRGRGGMDAMLFDLLCNRNVDIKVLNIGIDGQYRFELGDRASLHEKVGIGEELATARIREFAAKF